MYTAGERATGKVENPGNTKRKFHVRGRTEKEKIGTSSSARLQFIRSRDRNKFPRHIRPLLGHRAARADAFYEGMRRKSKFHRTPLLSLASGYLVPLMQGQGEKQRVYPTLERLSASFYTLSRRDKRYWPSKSAYAFTRCNRTDFYLHAPLQSLKFFLFFLFFPFRFCTV